MLSKQTIQELQSILQEEYGREDLSFEEVSKIARGLVGFYNTLTYIYHKGTKNKKQNHESTPK